MIDINLLRNEPGRIKKICEMRNCQVDMDRLITIDNDLREKRRQLDALRHERKKIKGKDGAERARELKGEIQELEKDVSALDSEFRGLFIQLPNLLADDTPQGKDESGNVEIYRWGQEPDFTFKPKTHEVIGRDLGILDLARGARVSGSGFFYWKGDGAMLVRAMFNFALDFLRDRGFTLMYTPILTKEFTLFGTGYLPFFGGEIYKVEEEDLALIGTSEQTLVGYHTDEIIKEADLPLRYTAFTPCFRTEAGAAGKKSRGAFRVHQFHKVEQIVFCGPEKSEEYHNRCQANAEDFMKRLEIPFRVVRVCVGDLGAPGYKKFDIEGWFAGFGQFRETHSNTNMLDYQTRRLNTRYKGEVKSVFPHTISATMATDRVALAILENNQQEDGSITIPTVLRPYMNGDTEIRPEAV